MSLPDFEQNCAFLIHDTARLIRRRFGLSIRDLQLTQAKWRVLTALMERPGISQSELAERLDIEKAPLGLALDWLEQAGWIERKADPADRRVRRAALLPKAEPALARMSERFRAIEANYLRGFDAEEVAQMLESLQVIRETLRTAAPTPTSAARTATVATPGTATATDTTTANARTETYVSVLFECARLLTRRFDARLAEMGFTRNQWLVMNTVYRNEGMRQTAIADATEIGAAPPTLAKHPKREVRRNHVDAGVGEGDAARAGAGGDVEHPLPGAGRDLLDDDAPPVPVDAGGEHVVGQVVLRGDVVEHRRHLVRLLLQAGAGHARHSARRHRQDSQDLGPETAGGCRFCSRSA